MQKSRQRWLRTFVEDRGILMGVKTNSFMIRNLWSGAALKRLLSVALFIGFVVLVEHYFGWVQLLTPWQTLSAGQILAAAGLAFVSYWTRAMRLYDYFRPPRMAEVPKMPRSNFPAARHGWRSLPASCLPQHLCIPARRKCRKRTTPWMEEVEHCQEQMPGSSFPAARICGAHLGHASK